MSGLVELARYQTKIEADLARLLLESQGVTVVPFDEGMGDLGFGSAMPVRLMVPESQLEDAARILAEEDER